MRSSDEKIIKITFFFSLLAHCIVLGVPGFNFNKSHPEKTKQISVQIEIEKPPLLPKIDVMGEEKKLPAQANPPSAEKQVIKEEKLPEPEPEPEPQPEEEEIVEELEQQSEEIVVEEPKPQFEEEKIIEEPKFKEQIEKEIIKQPQPEPAQEFIEVINPQKEAMLRYQDIIKQKIESCRRYPSWAKRQGLEGRVYLAFVVLSNGAAKDIKIVQSSGFSILDKEAVSTVKRANPFPPIPEEMKVSSLSMEVSILFTLQY